MTNATEQANALGYVQSPDGYWYHKNWKSHPGWQDRPWLDTAEECLEYDAVSGEHESAA